MLILTEKPSIAKDFATALGCAYSCGVYRSASVTVTNCVGHLFELEEPEHYGTHGLQIIPERFEYRTNPATEKQAHLVITTLRGHRNDEILIATDADREGEIIARECLAKAGITDFSRIKRFWVSQALTPEVIREGMRNARPLSEYDALAAQGFARQHADWLAGMNFSRLITQSAGRKLAIGRVQTAVLSAIEQRCDAIKNFRSEKYFEHYGIFKPTRDGQEATCKGIYVENGRTAFPDSTRAEKLESCTGKSARLTDSRTERKSSNPPQLYNLNALQKDAFASFGYSAGTTLKAVQSLYEGLKCVSYPRTPSRVMGSGNVELCRNVADTLTKSYTSLARVREAMNISGQNRRCFDDARLEAHHALIPLKALPTGATDEQKNTYLLILGRFFTAFLPAHEYERKTYILDVDGNTFRVTGRKVLSDGWKSPDLAKPVEELIPDRHMAAQDEEQLLEDIGWDSLILSKSETKEKWTRPPAPFNEASILAFMENPKAEQSAPDTESPQKKLAGLGTAATRHTFIPKLEKYGYIRTEKKNISVTELGGSLLKAVRESPIRSLADIAATTEWEERLTENPADFLSGMKSFVRESVAQDMKVTLPPPTTSTTTCPACGKEVRRGKSNWYCAGYKDGCTFTVWESIAGAKITEKDIAALCAGKTTGIKHCTSKAGKPFDCKLRLDGQGKAEFVFENKRK